MFVVCCLLTFSTAVCRMYVRVGGGILFFERCGRGGRTSLSSTATSKVNIGYTSAYTALAMDTDAPRSCSTWCAEHRKKGVTQDDDEQKQCNSFSHYNNIIISFASSNDVSRTTCLEIILRKRPENGPRKLVVIFRHSYFAARSISADSLSLFFRTKMSSDEDSRSAEITKQDWTTALVLQTLSLFFLTGLAEIGGGWLVWKCVRDNRRPWWWGLLGSAVLVLYGFLPTFQPVVDSFGRIYAVYGGFFIALSLLWGWGLDGDRPDQGDLIGSAVALLGVLSMLFWPFRNDKE